MLQPYSSIRPKDFIEGAEPPGSVSFFTSIFTWPARAAENRGYATIYRKK